MIKEVIRFIKELFCIHEYNLGMPPHSKHFHDGAFITYRKCEKCGKVNDGVLHEQIQE